MNEIQKIGRDPLTERDLYFLSINGINEIPNDINLSSPNYVCLIAWDSQQSTVEDISSVAESLIKNGGSYFCTWGPDCERMHDIIDEIDGAPRGIGIRLADMHLS